MGKVFFTSDLHFGHKRVIEYCNRPFASHEEMNEKLIEYHNALVSKADTVYNLGDVSLSRTWVRECVPKLNGRQILIKGNHDWCHVAQAKTQAKITKFEYQYLEAGFAEVHDTLELDIGCHKARLHHMPFFDPTAADLRYPNLRPVDDGNWLIHGHVHETWKMRGKQINVGVDVWDYKPVPIETIVQLMDDYLLSMSFVKSATKD